VRCPTHAIAKDLLNTQTQVLKGLIKACSRQQTKGALSAGAALLERPHRVAVEGREAVSAPSADYLSDVDDPEVIDIARKAHISTGSMCISNRSSTYPSG